MPRLCIRCGEEDAVDTDGYCAHCFWAVRVELQEGWYELLDYLAAWAEFADWCGRYSRVGGCAIPVVRRRHH